MNKIFSILVTLAAALMSPLSSADAQDKKEGPTIGCNITPGKVVFTGANWKQGTKVDITIRDTDSRNQETITKVTSDSGRILKSQTSLGKMRLVPGHTLKVTATGLAPFTDKNGRKYFEVVTVSTGFIQVPGIPETEVDSGGLINAISSFVSWLFD